MPTQKQKANRHARLAAVIILLGALAVQRWLTRGNDDNAEGRGLERRTEWLTYSKHAQCRMDCRRISKTEVEEILENGKINYRKSEIGERPECQRKYALEGRTVDGQRVRIIYAPCGKKITVVTVIDLDLENENCVCP
jgi:hypothetical protein